MVEATGVEAPLVIEAVNPENDDKAAGLRSFVENRRHIGALKNIFEYDLPLADLIEFEYVSTAALRTAPVKPATSVGVCFPEAVIRSVAERFDVGIDLGVGVD
jgi:hypothetical protein